MKKITFLVLSGFLFFLGFSQAAANENWRDISSINELIGKWEGNRVVEIPRDTEMFIPKSAIEINVTIEYVRGSKEVNGSMRLDMNRFLTDWLNIGEIKMLGFTKDFLWELFVDALTALDDFTIGDNYTVFYDLSSDADDFFQNNSDGDIQINGNGNRIRLLFFDTVSFGLGDEGFNEIVLDRR